MKCPTCQAWTLVKETRGEQRTRECANGHRFGTTEELRPMRTKNTEGATVMREVRIERALREAVAEAGGIAYKFTSPGRPGVPDRIVLLPGRPVQFVEVKRPGGKATPAQEREHARIAAMGYEVRVVSTLAEVAAFMESQA